MTDDLVTRLRESHFLDIAEAWDLCDEAADRIEQLTNERDKAARLGKSGGYKATPEHSWAGWCEELYRDLNTANDRIEQLELALKNMKVAELQAQLYRKRIHQLADALRKIAVTPPFGEPKEIALAALGVKGEFASELARAALEVEDEPR